MFAVFSPGLKKKKMFKKGVARPTQNDASKSDVVVLSAKTFQRVIISALKVGDNTECQGFLMAGAHPSQLKFSLYKFFTYTEKNITLYQNKSFAMNTERCPLKNWMNAPLLKTALTSRKLFIYLFYKFYMTMCSFGVLHDVDPDATTKFLFFILKVYSFLGEC